jgi:hypothetical protein
VLAIAIAIRPNKCSQYGATLIGEHEVRRRVIALYQIRHCGALQRVFSPATGSGPASPFCARMSPLTGSGHGLGKKFVGQIIAFCLGHCRGRPSNLSATLLAQAIGSCLAALAPQSYSGSILTLFLGRRLAVIDLSRRDIDDELGELGGVARALGRSAIFRFTCDAWAAWAACSF